MFSLYTIKYFHFCHILCLIKTIIYDMVFSLLIIAINYCIEVDVGGANKSNKNSNLSIAKNTLYYYYLLMLIY